MTVKPDQHHNRDLLPRNESTTTTGAGATTAIASPRIQCTANIVGITSLQIYEVLTSSSSSSATGPTNNPPPLTSARLDDHSSGISYLIRGIRAPDYSSDEDDDYYCRRILLWEHSTQTLKEQVRAPNHGVCGVTLLHPEHYPLLGIADSETNHDKKLMLDHNNLLVTCLGGFITRRRGGVGDPDHGSCRSEATAALRHVYAASPTTGVLCVWVLDSNSANNRQNSSGSSGGDGLQCNASIRLKLKDREVLTSLVPMNAADGTSSWLMISTSHGRLWKIYKTSRPLTLHAKLVKKRFIADGNSGDDNEGQGTGTTTGIVRGLYNYFTTPSKSINQDRSSAMTVEGGGTYDHGLSTNDEENIIVAVIPLPPTTTMTTTAAAAEVNATDFTDEMKNPGRSPTRSPPPRKQQRLSNIASTQYASSSSSSSSSPSLPPCAHVVSFSSSLVLKKWNISMLAGMELRDGANIISDHATDYGASHQEGYTCTTTLFPRNMDGTLDLSGLTQLLVHSSNDNSSNNNNNNNNNNNMIPEENYTLEGYDTVDLLATPALAKDGYSIIIGIRILKHNDLDATRAYVVRVSLLAGGDGQGVENSTLYILDAAWLDRYSGQSLSAIGETLDCAGLVVSEDNEEEIVVKRNATMVGGSVVYIGFGPGSSCGSCINGMDERGLQSCPVTISAIHFPSVDVALPRNNNDGRHPPRVKDFDLDSSNVPSIVRKSLSYDSLTGGCVVLATTCLLCGVQVRFPPMASSTGGEATTATSARRALDDASLLLLAQDESVITIKTHLQSSFRQYITKLKEGGGGVGGSSSSGIPARAVIPPSIMTCAVPILSAAVILASKDYISAHSSDGGGSVRGMSSPFVPRRTSTGGSSSSNAPIVVLRDKLQLHKDFVTFLLHAGAYRRVSTAGRVRLRDHGEVITATKSLLIECREYLAKEESTNVGGDISRRNELVQTRQRVMAALDGASNDVTNLPKRWANLQKLVSPNDDTTPLKDMLLLMISSSLCEGIGQALTYRETESSSLYDIPSFVSSSSSCSPWTSSTEMLNVLLAQLKLVQQMGEYVLSTSNDYDAEMASVRKHVGDLSAAILSGYRDVVSCEPNNDEASKRYEDAKSLTIHLLRQYVNAERDDFVALKTSIEHSFFEGIVQICHDHRKSWMYRGLFADEGPDAQYDLRTMIASSSSDSPYLRLHQSRDYGTGLSFCNYVLRWYTDRGYYSEVFELGKHCLHDLTRFVRNDNRLSDLAWRQHLRVGWYEKATAGLQGISSPLLFGMETGVMGLWEKEQMMSLAKLSNKLAAANDGTYSKVVDQSAESIENNLTLISAQRSLQEENDDVDNEAALDEDEILKLVVEKMQSSSDADEIERFGFIGLSVASAKPLDQIEAMSNAASYIWYAVVQADINVWRDVANDNAYVVGGMDEECLMHRVEGTVFVGLLNDFLSKSSEVEKQHVGFVCTNVKNQVLRALGSEELAKVLTVAADIVMNAQLEAVLDDAIDG